MKVFIKTNKAEFHGILNDSLAATSIYEILPLKALINTWGEEIYFEIPLKIKDNNLTKEVEIGDIAYWPQGHCLCIFFGKTPLSNSKKPVPASEVNLVGRITSDISELKKLQAKEEIIITKES